MIYTIVIDKQSRENPSGEQREFDIEVGEELRKKGNVYDEICIKDGKAKLIRRISIGKYKVTKILDTPIETDLGEIKLQLFEGDNYIYVKDKIGNHLYAEYLVKNEFNNIYVIRAELDTAIEQTEKSISFSVNRKLEEYSTTEETKAMIELESDKISSEVSKKYATQDEVKSSVTQTAEEIKAIVSASIGTVNLVSNSDFSHLDDENNSNGYYDLKNWSFYGAKNENTGVILINEKTWLRIYKDDIGSVLLSQILKPVKINEDYTLSFKLKNNSLETGKERNNTIRVNVYFYSSNDEVIDSSFNIFTIADNLNEQSLNCTFHTPNNDNLNYIDFRIQIYNTLASDDISSTVFDASITNIQLEIGKVATEWRASQTDYYNKIEQYSKVVQTVDEISTEVSKKVGNNEIISKINQSAEKIRNRGK